MEGHRGILNVYRKWKANLKRLYTAWFQPNGTKPQKRQNYGDSKKISGPQRLWAQKGWVSRVQRIFRAVKLLYVKLLWWLQLNIHLSKLIEHTTPRMDPNAKHEPWVVMICQWRFINCKKTYPLGRNVDNGVGVAVYVCGEWACRNCDHFLVNFTMNQKVLKQ